MEGQFVRYHGTMTEYRGRIGEVIHDLRRYFPPDHPDSGRGLVIEFECGKRISHVHTRSVTQLDLVGL